MLLTLHWVSNLAFFQCNFAHAMDIEPFALQHPVVSQRNL